MSDLIGSSATFQALLDKVDMVAPVDSAILIQGETGTGKEVIARAIHDAGPRRRNRFVALNCAAIPATLLESELFGYEKGAFTGAVTQTQGRFQAADRGTLFLDEIGDLPVELQPKLLRVLQEKQVERLGGGHTQNVDVRVIAATNQNLEQMVDDRKFRADLFYRLNVFPISIPPLRERWADIPLLAQHFVQKFARKQGKVIHTIPDDVMMRLQEHSWPGNIRELQNVIERGVIMTAGTILSWQTMEPLKSRSTTRGPFTVAVDTEPKTLADAERAHIAAVLRETNGVIGGPRGAAVQLGLPRTTLIAKMQRLGIGGVVPHGRSTPSPHVVRVMRGGTGSRMRDDSSPDLSVLEAAI